MVYVSLTIMIVLFSFQGTNCTIANNIMKACYEWAWVDSNHRPHAYQACALTRLSYRPILERVKGVEPSTSAWKAEVLPLNYTRNIGFEMVGKTGLEPAAPWSQTMCSTKLSYFPEISRMKFVLKRQ